MVTVDSPSYVNIWEDGTLYVDSSASSTATFTVTSSGWTASRKLTPEEKHLNKLNDMKEKAGKKYVELISSCISVVFTPIIMGVILYMGINVILYMLRLW